MKKYILLSIFLYIFADAKEAIQETALERMGLIKVGECYDIHQFDVTIISRIDDHHYELRSDNSIGPRILLETKKAVYEDTGRPIGVGIKHIGQKKLKLENGFSAEYVLWQECSIIQEVFDVDFAQRNPQYSYPLPIITKKAVNQKSKKK